MPEQVHLTLAINPPNPEHCYNSSSENRSCRHLGDPILNPRCSLFPDARLHYSGGSSYSAGTVWRPSVCGAAAKVGGR